MDAALLELLNQTVTFQEHTETDIDGRGNMVGTWENATGLVGLPTRLEYPSIREDRNGRTVVVKRPRCFIDGGHAVTEEHRAIIDGRIFEITAVHIRYDENGDENHRTIQMIEIDSGT